MRIHHTILVGVAVIASLGGCGSSDDNAGVDLKPIESDGPRGSVDLTQDGDQITGTVRLEGLEPGSAHAMHLHGEPDGTFSCAGEKTPAHLINFPDLLADDEGVAELALDFVAPEDTLRPGTYVMTHEEPRTPGEVATDARIVPPDAEPGPRTNPPIACADIGAR